jgi:hypothetical protein
LVGEVFEMFGPRRDGRNAVSLAWYIVLEREIPGVETFINGQALARAGELLDSLAADAEVLPLSSFFSVSAEEMTGFAADHGVDLNDLGTAPAEKWFSPQDGLKTLAALVEAAQTRKMDDVILEDLKAFQKVLRAAQAKEVRWHLAIDY